MQDQLVGAARLRASSAVTYSTRHGEEGVFARLEPRIAATADNINLDQIPCYNSGHKEPVKS
jgi:hypothetical protein